MKVYVFRAKRAVLCFFALALAGALAAAVLPRGRQAISVQTEARLVPIYSVDTKEQNVALTFNAAWDDAQVNDIVDILNRYEIKCTFFVVGQWAEKYPEALKKLADNGHEIAMHSYSHPDMTKIDEQKIREQCDKNGDAIRRVTGETPQLFRVPSGAYNNLVLQTLENCGKLTIQWDVDSIDWKKIEADEIVKRVTQKSRGGSIILMHVGAKNTVSALPGVIEGLKEKGLSLVKVGDMIYKNNFTIDRQGCQHLNA